MVLTNSFIMQKNGQTWLKHPPGFTSQVFKRILDHFLHYEEKG